MCATPIRATIEAIECGFVVDGPVQRYPTDIGIDGLLPGVGYLFSCSVGLTDTRAVLGCQAKTKALFERPLARRIDVGRLAEEFDLRNRRALGKL